MKKSLPEGIRCPFKSQEILESTRIIKRWGVLFDVKKG